MASVIQRLGRAWLAWRAESKQRTVRAARVRGRARPERAELRWWVAVCLTVGTFGGETRAGIDQPLSLAGTVELALRQNPAIRKAAKELEAAHGVVIQTRAIALPKLGVTGSYQARDPDAVDRITVPLFDASFRAGADESWSSGIRLTQSLYEGGRMRSALRSARLIRDQALLEYQTVVAAALVEVRVAYFDVLLALQQIEVRDASVRLLEEEYKDAVRRRDAGTVPQFNVLRAEVEWANAKPALIRARNTYRNAKIRLANLLGLDVPVGTLEDLPLRLTGTLDGERVALIPLDLSLPQAVSHAWEHRTELASLRKAEALRQEGIVVARAGYRPSLGAFGGYEARNGFFGGGLDDVVDGWVTGVQLSWNLFDGRLTEGRIAEAKARRERAQIDVEDAARQTELDVRTAYSNWIEAREVLDSQEKVRERAQEALRLATARYQAGSSTQLDVLAAETSLTEARTTQVQALRDFLVARARLDRAVGLDLPAAVSAVKGQ